MPQVPKEGTLLENMYIYRAMKVETGEESYI